MEWQGTAETYHESIELGIESFVGLSYGREIGATMQMAKQEGDKYVYYVDSPVSLGGLESKIVCSPPQS